MIDHHFRDTKYTCLAISWRLPPVTQSHFQDHHQQSCRIFESHPWQQIQDRHSPRSHPLPLADQSKHCSRWTLRPQSPVIVSLPRSAALDRTGCDRRTHPMRCLSGSQTFRALCDRFLLDIGVSIGKQKTGHSEIVLYLGHWSGRSSQIRPLIVRPGWRLFHHQLVQIQASPYP